MSFFGFDTTLPRDKANQSGAGRGIFDSHDPFAALSGSRPDDDGTAGVTLDFEDTYDGLGQQLEESGDTFNDDTFGPSGGPALTRESVGKDFDFAGQTAQVQHSLQQEQQQQQSFRNNARPMVQQSKPTRTGYEAYKQPEYIPKLEADASIWGTAIAGRSNESTSKPAAPSTKMMSLEDVEAAMRAQARPAAPPQDVHSSQTLGLKNMLGLGGRNATPPSQPAVDQAQSRPPQILQRPQQLPPGQQAPPGFPIQQQHQQPHQDAGLRAPQILQRQQSPQQPIPAPSQQFPRPPPVGPARAPPVQAPRGPAAAAQQPGHARGPSYPGLNPQQVQQMAPADREAYLAEEARRAKRNHKIFLLSKYNGLMTPQDKNFITRIQLQQLLTATGGVFTEPGSEEQIAEDFYYQVYAQIRGPPRTGPGHPLNQFAQTYLFQTGSRYGYGRSRHHPRGGGADNHVQRMEQQVARAVEAAKARPKNKQLTLAGSLGKIAFSNSKTPRPLLHLKRPESVGGKQSGAVTKPADRKTALRDIEALYTVLMRLEDHERRLPPPPHEESPPEVIEGHMRWRREMQALNQQLWEASKVMEPIQPNPTTAHPFIQILSAGKGKKALPRVFRHLDDQQRLTLLTLLALHLDQLDVVRDAYPPADPNATIPARVRDEVELFGQAVMPPLFSYVNEAPLGIIIGLVGLILDRVVVPIVVRTKVGLSVLTMLISRAELVKQVSSGPGAPGSAGPAATAEDWAHWADLYARLFDTLEPILPYIFPMPVSNPSTASSDAPSEDVHIWQFLAAMGVGATPDQQQRLVLGVKDRVLETVASAQTLPAGGPRERRLGEVNLFMRAIGLDVELLG